MDHHVTLSITVAAVRIVAIICFTILAVVFNHWWIVFFSFLFYPGFPKVKYQEEEKEEQKE